MAVPVYLYVFLVTLCVVTSASCLDSRRPEKAMAPLPRWQETPRAYERQGTTHSNAIQDRSVSSWEKRYIFAYLTTALAEYLMQGMIQGENQMTPAPTQCTEEMDCRESASMACCWVPKGPYSKQCVPKVPTSSVPLHVELPQQPITRQAMLDSIRRQIREFDSMPRKTFHVMVLPVGQGDCIAMFCPNGDLVMFDCGSVQPKNALTAEDVQYVIEGQFRRATIFISHGDIDHNNHLPTIFNDISKIDRVIIGGHPRDYQNDEDNQWIHTVASQGKLYGIGGCLKCIGNCNDKLNTVEYMYKSRSRNKDWNCNSGQMTSLNHMNICGSPDISFDIIAANVKNGTNNQRSIVLKVTAGSRSVLFTGDIEGPAAKDLAKSKPNRLKSNVFQISHHGASSKANTQEWLQEIQPEEAFVSHAYNGGKHHPQCDAIQRLISVGSISTQVPTLLPFHCANKKEKGGSVTGKIFVTGEICHRIYSTYPAEDEICTVRFGLGGSPYTTYTCFSVMGSGAEEDEY